MLTTEQIDQAAHHLLKARLTKTPGGLIPEAYRPTDRESAIAIQQRTIALLGEPVGGWKCGVPPANGPLVFAPIPAAAIFRTSPCPVPPPKGRIEPEIAFVVAHDMPPRATPYTEEEIRGSIKEARMVLELIATRYQEKFSATPIDLLADCYNNHGLFVGPVIPHVFDLKLETLPVKIVSSNISSGEAAGETLFEKVHPHPSGNPMKSYSWLVHFLNQHGLGLKAGQIVTTGSYAGIVEAPVGVPLQVELGGVGAFHVALITERS